MEEKRKINNYTITQAIRLGSKEIVFGEIEDSSIKEIPYLCAFCNDNGIIERYVNCVFSDDYLETMKVYVNRIQEQIAVVENELSQAPNPKEVLGNEHCDIINHAVDIKNKIVVIKPNILLPEYRTATQQLVYVTGGFGASKNSHGSAVFVTNVYNAKESRWERSDILGIIKPQHIPEWAKDKIKQIEKKQKKEHQR